MALDWKNTYAEMHAHGEAAYPPAALHYLLQLCRQSSTQIDGKVLTPEYLVGEFRKRVQRDFGSLTPQVLEDWNLRTSEDLGKAIILLARYNCLILEPSDTVEAFAALGLQL